MFKLNFLFHYLYYMHAMHPAVALQSCLANSTKVLTAFLNAIECNSQENMQWILEYKRKNEEEWGINLHHYTRQSFEKSGVSLEINAAFCRTEGGSIKLFVYVAAKVTFLLPDCLLSYDEYFTGSNSNFTLLELWQICVNSGPSTPGWQ